MTENKDDVTLIVNSREREISSKVLSSDGEITFDQVVKLAYTDPPSGPYIELAVSYWNGAGRPTEGILYPGESVKVQDGTVFNVTVNDNS